MLHKILQCIGWLCILTVISLPLFLTDRLPTKPSKSITVTPGCCTVVNFKGVPDCQFHRVDAGTTETDAVYSAKCIFKEDRP